MEIWKPLPCCASYSVSSHGRVKGPQGLKTAAITYGGYLRVQLYYRGKAHCCSVHSLVMRTFVGKRPTGKVINHKNGNKTDNALANLEYLTYSQNAQHARQTNLIDVCKGEQHPLAKTTDKDVMRIFADAARGVQRRHLATKYGISKSIVDNILLRKDWKHVTVPEHLLESVRQQRRHRNQGKNNPLSKLTEKDIPRIFALAKEGQGIYPIAKRFGVNHSLISQVLHRVVWAHVAIPSDLLPRVKPSRRLTWN